jgi:7-cyano-7-deazaguanine synthase
MDSTTLATMYLRSGYDLQLLSFDYGQRHRARELSAASDVADNLRERRFGTVRHTVINLLSVGEMLTGSALTDSGVEVPDGHYAEESMKSTVVPNRNAIMANIAIGIASSAGSDVVALGVHAGDHAVYPDCRPEFVKALRQCMTHALKGFHTPRLEAPFLRRTKQWIASTGTLAGAPLHLSWSCYKGGTIHCGKCGTCVERREAFELAGVSDPTDYES